MIRKEIKAKVIITVPNPKDDESIESIILKVEHELNEMAVFEMPVTKTKIGIRVHLG